MSTETPSDERDVRSTMQGLLKKTSDCTTADGPDLDHVTEGGRVVLRWQVTWGETGSRRAAGGPRLGEFSKSQMADLRSLSETAGRKEVRRAARALLRYAEGATMKEAVAPTPYGVGWLRGLREDVAEQGVGYLQEREYRAPR